LFVAVTCPFVANQLWVGFSSLESLGIAIPSVDPSASLSRPTDPSSRSLAGQSLSSSSPLRSPSYHHQGVRVADVYRLRRQMVVRYLSDTTRDGKSTTTTLSRLNQQSTPSSSVSMVLLRSSYTRIDPSYLPFDDVREMREVCDRPPGTGAEKQGGWDLLTQKIRVLLPSSLPTTADGRRKKSTPRSSSWISRMANFLLPPRWIAPSRPPTPTSPLSRSKLLCVVYTHSNRGRAIRAVTETWGWRCDGFFAASNLTDPSIGSIDLPHKGPETYMVRCRGCYFCFFFLAHKFRFVPYLSSHLVLFWHHLE
jgi:hypothetical protein